MSSSEQNSELRITDKPQTSQKPFEINLVCLFNLGT